MAESSKGEYGKILWIIVIFILSHSIDDILKFGILSINLWVLAGGYAYLLGSILDLIGNHYIYHSYLIYFEETNCVIDK